MDEQQGAQSNNPPFHELRQNVNALIGICQIVSRLVEVFLRVPGSWGERFASFQMLGSWVLAFFWVAFYPQEEPRPMMWLVLAATGMLLVHRIVGVWRRRWGREVHSRYPGDSLVGGPTRECVLLAIASVVALAFNKPLGAYLTVSSICFWVSQAWQQAADKARIRNLRDLRIDQQNVMRQMQDEA
jgi:hypothetical protein